MHRVRKVQTRKDDKRRQWQDDNGSNDSNNRLQAASEKKSEEKCFNDIKQSMQEQVICKHHQQHRESTADSQIIRDVNLILVFWQTGFLANRFVFGLLVFIEISFKPS